MKRVFFIDYENVDTNGLNGLSSLTSQDEIYIYYSESHSRMSFGLHRRLCESRALIMYRKIRDKSKNALDEELMQEADTVINDTKADYYIISKDRGYDRFIKELRSYGYKVYRNENIKSTNDDKRVELQNKIRSRIGNMYDLSEEQVEWIASAIMKADNKSELNRSLQKMFYNKDVKYVFERIKDITYSM